LNFKVLIIEPLTRFDLCGRIGKILVLQGGFVDHTREVELPVGFLDDIKDLDGSIIKCYLVLKELADITKALEKCEPTGEAKVHCSYKYIQDEANVSKSIVRKSIIELTIKGWICGFKRGHNGGNHKEKVSNEYSIPFVRTYNREAYAEMIDWRSKK
jgi:hypothetical protein